MFHFYPRISFQKSVYAADGWAGKFWSRTWCDKTTNHCETGDCDSTLQCMGKGATPPVTFVDITLKEEADDSDTYDISLVDGFNTRVTVRNFICFLCDVLSHDCFLFQLQGH